MKVCHYLGHVLHIANQELPALLPYGDNQTIVNDEVIDIILYGTPKSWQRKMDHQGFDPLENTINEVVSFME